MKNLGNVVNEKDVPRNKDLFEIPYGTVLTVPKQRPTPEGFIEWGTLLKAEDYPHLVELFGTTNITLKPVKVSMTSNDSNSELYIDTSAGMETNYNCDESFNNLWKIFDGDKENGYFAGDGVSTTYEPNQYNRRMNFSLRGSLISGLYDMRDKVSLIKSTYSWRQNNASDYDTPVFWLNTNLSGSSSSSSNPNFSVAPNEEITNKFTNYIFITNISNQPEKERYIQVASWASYAKLLEIFEIEFELPVVTSDLYIDVPLDWTSNQSMLATLQSENMKLIMYVGNSIK